METLNEVIERCARWLGTITDDEHKLAPFRREDLSTVLNTARHFCQIQKAVGKTDDLIYVGGGYFRGKTPIKTRKTPKGIRHTYQIIHAPELLALFKTEA